MDFKILDLKIINQKEYLEFLLRNKNSLFYQHPRFHSLLEEHLKAKVFYFVWLEGGSIIATFPFFIKHNKNFGNVINSIPYYGSNGSFVFELELSESDRTKIRFDFLQRFEKFANEQNVVCSTIITSPFQLEDTVFFEKEYKFTHLDERVGQVTTFPKNSNEIDNQLLSTFENPRPRNIRKAIKSGVKVEKKHDINALRFLFEVHKANIESIGGKPKEWQFFELIPSFFNKNDFAIYIAYIEDKPISALLIFYFNKTVEYYTPATIHEFRNLQPSALLIFQAMKEAITLGYQNWNWGGTWFTQKGVYDFKKKWGAKDFNYKYFINVRNAELLAYHDKKQLIESFPYFYLFPY